MASLSGPFRVDVDFAVSVCKLAKLAMLVARPVVALMAFLWFGQLGCCYSLVTALSKLDTDVLSAGCEEHASDAICFGSNKEHVILPDAVPAGLVGAWTFDNSLPQDVSGYGNHGLASVQAGPSLAGQGSSAHFFKTDFMVVPGEGVLATLQDFSYSFWIHLLDDATGAKQGLRVCPLLRKGSANTQDGQSPLPASPAIFLDRQSRHLRVEVGTVGGPLGQMVDLGSEALDSNARLASGRWYHIAVVRLNGQRRTRLYVNGILDASQSTKGFTAPNSGPLYVGGDPSVRDRCNVPMYIDEVKIYNRPLSHDEIQAEAAPALAGVEASFLRLACVDCPLQVAMQNCPDTFHICNSLELHMGGYQVARSLGYLQNGAHVWSHAVVPDAKGKATMVSAIEGLGFAASAPPQFPSKQLGLGLCCADAS